MPQRPVGENEPAAAWAGSGRVWDVIVVGAGPAGSTAARTAAEAGAEVLLLDRAAFPRYKTCGGGLLGESLRLIPESARSTIESRVAEAVITDRFRRRVVVRREQPFLAMVRRAEFDQALADAATDAGAHFIDGVTVREITQHSPGEVAEVTDGDRLVEVRTTAGTARARVVIGADGTSGRVGRYVGVRAGGVDLGLEDEVAMPADADAWRDRVHLDWGDASGSYAWVFPKHDSLTVGVIQRKGSPDETREYLTAWRRHLGLAGPESETLHSSGHLTQWRAAGSPLRRGSVIVAGDAAGLLEPWTREGISFALRSGTWAGEAAAAAARVASASPSASSATAAGADAGVATAAVAGAAAGAGAGAAAPAGATTAAAAAAAAEDRALSRYEHRVAEALEPEQTTGTELLQVFERRRALVHTLLASPPGARWFVRFCRGDTTLARFARHRLVMRLVRALR